MRRALLDYSDRTRGATSFQRSIPAPVGGWNTRDALAAMTPTDAPLLDNWFCRQGQVELRGGSLDYSTGMSGSAQSTFQYSPTSGTKKLYASTNSGVYDVTAGGAVGAVVKAATNGYINTVNFANSAGTNYLWCCNGTDIPFFFDGATWTNTAITGIVTPANLTWPVVFKHRIFAIEKNTMNLWYLPIDSIQGLAAVLPFGNFLKKGGSLQSAANWTLDAGEGVDDLLAVVSTEGQLAVYKGTDPASASSWALVGVYDVGRPLGRRCFAQFGGDLVILTENGAFPLSRLITSGNINFVSALSAKIQNTWATTVATVGITTVGWDVVVYPQFDAMIVNIPVAGPTPAAQFAMNTVTGAWSSFSSWALTSFIVYQGQFYFTTTTGRLVRAWDYAGALTNDNGVDIVTTAHPAYNNFGLAEEKRIELFRWLMSFNGSVQFSWGVSSDFNAVPLSSTVSRGLGYSGSLWDTIFWDTHLWASVVTAKKFWRNVAHVPGKALALWLQTATKDSNLAWAGTEFILHKGSAM